MDTSLIRKLEKEIEDLRDQLSEAKGDDKPVLQTMLHDKLSLLYAMLNKKEG